MVDYAKHAIPLPASGASSPLVQRLGPEAVYQAGYPVAPANYAQQSMLRHRTSATRSLTFEADYCRRNAAVPASNKD